MRDFGARMPKVVVLEHTGLKTQQKWPKVRDACCSDTRTLLHYLCADNQRP